MDLNIVNIISANVNIPNGDEVTAIAVTHGGGKIMVELNQTNWYHVQQDWKLKYTKNHPVVGFIQVYRNGVSVYSGSMCRDDEHTTYDEVMEFANTYNRQSA